MLSQPLRLGYQQGDTVQILMEKLLQQLVLLAEMGWSRCSQQPADIALSSGSLGTPLPRLNEKALVDSLGKQCEL